jgi:hypothetical protein
MLLPWGLFFSSKEQGRKEREKGKSTVLLAQFWQESAGTLLPEASPVQPSMAAKKERNVQKRPHWKKRAEKTQKIESSPWPVTVQVWASFVSPDPVQTSFTESLPAAHNGLKHDVSVLTLSKGTRINSLGSPVPLVQASWEEMAPGADAKREIKKNQKHKGCQGKKDNDQDHTWPLEIQAWVSSQAAAAAAAADNPVQTLKRGHVSTVGMLASTGEWKKKKQRVFCSLV